MDTPAAVFPAVRPRAAVDTAILPRPTQAAAIRAAGVAMPPLTRAAAIPARAATTAPDTAVQEAATILAGSTTAEVITTADASGLARTLASVSASPSAGATIRAPVAATMTDTVIGSRLPAIRTSTRVTDRVAPGTGESRLSPELAFLQPHTLPDFSHFHPRPTSAGPPPPLPRDMLNPDVWSTS